MIWISVLLLTAIVFLLLYYIVQRAARDYVIKNSRALKELIKINAEFSFCDIRNPIETHTYDNDVFYNSISCQDYLIYQLRFKKISDLKLQADQADDNAKRYPIYLQALSNIHCFGDFHQKLFRQFLCSVEKKLFEQGIKHPVLKSGISVILYCSNINGRVYNYKTQFFTFDEIKALVRRSGNRTGDFYLDRDIWDAICRVERGKVSNKMRFSIYRRDGYRCRYCGRTGRNLEIDHIKPIAKGGKSTYDNLQTLCAYCNKEKGDTYFE